LSTSSQEGVLAFLFLRARNRARPAPLPKKEKTLSPSDEDLMARLRDKDVNAFDLLFLRHARLVLGIGRRILRDYAAAEEVVQDSFFYLFKKARQFDPERGTAKAWIVQIATHRALDRKSYLDRRGFSLGTEASSLDDTLVGKTDLDREVGARLIRVQLEKAFDELPEIQRRTLELFFFEGWDLREISEKMKLPMGNVRHYFYRGLARLRKSSFVQKLQER
jgi:RNA polymerase sigma-70 factor, ECF subfamily